MLADAAGCVSAADQLLPSLRTELALAFAVPTDFSIADVVFTPMVERMNASLFYYKGACSIVGSIVAQYIVLV